MMEEYLLKEISHVYLYLSEAPMAIKITI
jgi:hypothetical protein